jgi:hypothetical protein
MLRWNTSAAEIATTTITPAGTPETTLFSGLTLPAGTYYLMLSAQGNDLGGWLVGTTPVVTAPGISLDFIYASFAHVNAAYPPASTWASTSAITLAFDVTADPFTPPAAPVLPTWGMLLLAGMVATLALALLSKSRRSPFSGFRTSEPSRR